MTTEEIVQMIRDEAAYVRPYVTDPALSSEERSYCQGEYRALLAVATRIEHRIATSKRPTAVQGKM